jgi:hypothetical protein
MYKREDFESCIRHHNLVIVVWCGSDGIKIRRNRKGVKMLRGRKNIIHYATSKWISDDLTSVKIPHKILPITPASVNLSACPRGDKIYIYYGSDSKKEFYGHPLAEEVEKRTGIEVVYAAHDSYSHNDLIEVYKQCFIGLRLTKHDGVSVTAIELGMMGRRCIFNGDSPNSIPWTDLDDICESVMKEYNNRHLKDYEQVSEETKKYLNIGNEWLNV